MEQRNLGNFPKRNGLDQPPPSLGFLKHRPALLEDLILRHRGRLRPRLQHDEFPRHRLTGNHVRDQESAFPLAAHRQLDVVNQPVFPDGADTSPGGKVEFDRRVDQDKIIVSEPDGADDLIWGRGDGRSLLRGGSGSGFFRGLVLLLLASKRQ